MMATRSGAIRGFLAGVAVTVVVAGLAGYLFYKGIQSKLSPEAIRKAAERKISAMMQQPVTVGSADLQFPNLITLKRLRINSEDQPLLVAERIEAYAEGGVQGVEQGRFSRLVVTNPVISLERKNGTWNLASFLSPFLEKKSSGGVSDSTGSAEPAGPIPLTLIEVTGLKMTVTLGEKDTYSAVDFGELTFSRENPGSPWNVHARNGNLRLNPAEGEWPLLEAVGLARGIASQEPGKSADRSNAQPQEANTPSWLGEVVAEEVNVQFVHTNQILSASGLSFQAKNLFELIRLRTGSLEKKTSRPSA